MGIFTGPHRLHALFLALFVINSCICIQNEDEADEAPYKIVAVSLSRDDEQRYRDSIATDTDMRWRASAFQGDSRLAEDDLVVILRMAHVEKEKMLNLSPAQVRVITAQSVADGISLLPPSIRVSVFVLYDTESLGSYLEETMMEMECIFKSVLVAAGANEAKAPPLTMFAHILSKKSGNRETNLVQYEFVENEVHGDPIVYFVEEDYLHSPSALKELVQILQFNRSAFATGFDHPDRYWDGKPHGKFRDGHHDRNGGLSHIVADPSRLDRHWRTADSTTMTFACRRNLFREYINIFSELAPRDSYIWPMLAEEHNLWLFTPLPCLVTHMHYQQCFYGFDWFRLAIRSLDRASNNGCWKKYS